ncbi:MAG: YIP1 family protein [Actinobacteria bacterium]|nr:MAG: YIP1 family protein [Actinomycetota bacterium]
MTAAAESTPSLQREWWLRALAVFTSPRGTFAALSDDSPEGAEARQEPIMAIVILAGIAGVLSTSLAGRLMDDPNYDGLNVAVWAFLGGAFYGFLAYWGGGLLVYAIAAAVRVRASYRQARQIVGLAMAPVALSLIVLWPVRLGIYGEDVFRTGGSDTGAGDKLLEVLLVGSFAWSFALVVLGLIELRKRSSSSSAIA